MKKYSWFYFVVLLMFLGIACTPTSEDEDNPADGSSAEAYYPGASGSTFTYQGERTDSNGLSVYTRNVNFVSGQSINNLTYIQQNNVITAGPVTTSGDFLFRTSTTGMFIYIDPTIFTEILDSSGIDPNLVTISSDQEIRMIAYPFADTPQWNAFTVKVNAVIVSLNILEVTGNYRGQEQVAINQQSLTAEKVEYIATIKIPESIADIANPKTVTVKATAWFVKDVGLVKLQGSGFLISVLGGSDINFESDNSTATEILVSYSIQ